MQQDIIIQRGNNVGQAIKDKLKASNLYGKVKILTFDIKRNKADKTITASITYKYKI